MLFCSILVSNAGNFPDIGFRTIACPLTYVSMTSASVNRLQVRGRCLDWECHNHTACHSYRHETTRASTCHTTQICSEI